MFIEGSLAEWNNWNIGITRCNAYDEEYGGEISMIVFGFGLFDVTIGWVQPIT